MIVGAHPNQSLELEFTPKLMRCAFSPSSTSLQASAWSGDAPCCAAAAYPTAVRLQAPCAIPVYTKHRIQGRTSDQLIVGLISSNPAARAMRPLPPDGSGHPAGIGGLLTNPALVSALLSCLVAQLLKPVLHQYLHPEKQLDWKWAVSPGGSEHTGHCSSTVK
jgi:hypothetical protein